MGVITISRQYGAGGEEVAEKISKVLGYRIIARKEIENKLIDIAGQQIAEKVIAEKAPGIIERITVDRRIWKNLLIESILSFAVDGNVLILGRGSFDVFRDVPGVLDILVSGNLKQRVKYVIVKEGINSLHAEEKIERIDRERSGFLNYYYGVDWPHPSLFHFSANPLRIGIDECAGAIEALASFLFYREDFEKKRKKAIQEKYFVTVAENRIILSVGIDLDLFSLRVKEGNKVEIKFFNVPTEVREKAIITIGELMEGYTIHQMV